MSSVLDRPPTVGTWHAMGTTVTVEVSGPPTLVELARHRLATLELRWSRFLDGSDIARMNATRGIPVFVHRDTRLLVRHGIAAWDATAGACDPSVYDAVVGAGYDTSFEYLADRPTSTGRPAAVPGCGGIVVDDELGSVTLPVGVGFDPGAIGKGLAADLLADELIDAGAEGVFVSIGGDIRMAGRAPSGDGWTIEVFDHAPNPAPPMRLAVTGGALATSTTQRRWWRVAGEKRHHIIDPRTGRCARPDARTVTVLAAEAWWAEALATRLLLAPRSAWPTLGADGAALVVDTDGAVHVLGRMEAYLR